MVLCMLVLLLQACRPSAPAGGDSAASCADGEVRDGDTCVPEACGTGPWGAAALDEDAVFVAAGG